MLQITNQTSRYRKQQMNWQLKDSFNSHLGKLNRLYFKTYRDNQNITTSLSTPKNFKVLPRLQKNNQKQSPYRYIQTPSNEIYYNRMKINQPNQHQTTHNVSNMFFRSQKKRTFEGIKQEKHSYQLNLTTSIQDKLNLQNNHNSKYYVVNRKGKRPYNQDRFICKNNLHKLYFMNQNVQSCKNGKKEEQIIGFYSVFDGHGGSACAEFLKDNFSNFLLRTKNLQTDPQQSLKQAYKVAEEKFISLCQAKNNCLQTSGACALSCLIIDNKITVASVGDCRAIMFNRQYLCEMTKDHKPTEISQKMRIIKCGGKIYRQEMRINRSFHSAIKNFSSVRITPGNLNVSRTIGDIEAKVKKYGGLPGMISAEPEIKTFQKENYQILLMASDGLFEAFTNKQIQQFYYKTVEYEKRKVILSAQIGQRFIEQLVSEAEKKSTDNITIIVVLLNPSPNLHDNKTPTVQNLK